jgi:hypothetical protein
VQGSGRNRTLVSQLSAAGAPESGVAGSTIRFFADGVSIGSAVTDADGVATLAVPPRYRGGGHAFAARFEGDDRYSASSASTGG